jgi:hypothetical protein
VQVHDSRKGRIGGTGLAMRVNKNNDNDMCKFELKVWPLGNCGLGREKIVARRGQGRRGFKKFDPGGPGLLGARI